MTPDTLAKSNTEHGHQRALFAWSNMAFRYGLKAANDDRCYTEVGHAEIVKLNPILQLEWLHAIHNQGHGDAIRGAKAKAEGVKAGVADIFLPVSSDLYHGLYIELKRFGGKPSAEQLKFQTYCRANGYVCEFAEGWRNAANVIVAYLGLTA